MEYTAMVYRKGRNTGFVANCIVKNLIGFGKTEEDAINNLKESIEKITKMDASIKPMYGLSLAK